MSLHFDKHIDAVLVAMHMAGWRIRNPQGVPTHGEWPTALAVGVAVHQ
jgi:hypothetical protein